MNCPGWLLRASIKLIAPLLFVALISITPQHCRALNPWNQGPSGIGNDKLLRKSGATELTIRYVTESDTDSFTKEAFLEGFVAGKVIWSKKIPLEEEVNLAKCWAEAKVKDKFEIASQYPGTAATFVQVFSWNGKKVSLVSSHGEDKTAEFFKGIVSAAVRGDRKLLQKRWQDAEFVMYPQSWTGRSNLEDAMKEGHRSALRLFKKGKPAAAADRLKLIFDTISEMYSMSDICSTDSNADAWLSVWNLEDLSIDKKVYIPVLNDYGFFLQKAGKHSEAIVVFKKVIEKDKDRAVAYLNLADSYWATKARNRARNSYGKYKELMIEHKKESKIPPRVFQRSDKSSKPDPK